MIESKQDLRYYMAEDLGMAGIDRWRPKYRVTLKSAYWLRLLRRTEYWGNCRRGPIGRLMAVQLQVRGRLLGQSIGLSAPRNRCGPGLGIVHFGLTLIHGEARVGSRVRILQGVTIGAAHGGTPTIGDDVFIGPNVVILGPITIGDGAELRAGSVVTKDVPAGAVVQGTSAEVVRVVEGRVPWSPNNPNMT